MWAHNIETASQRCELETCYLFENLHQAGIEPERQVADIAKRQVLIIVPMSLELKYRISSHKRACIYI